MAGKPIQEQFGERVIEAFAEFARQDLKAPGDYEADEFAHVADADLRRRLSEVFYGARWIYKLGLAPHRRGNALNWNPNSPEKLLNRQSFWWLITVAEEEGIVGAKLAKQLHSLRIERNSVHLRQKSSLGRTAFLNQSKKAFQVAIDTVTATKTWKATHP